MVTLAATEAASVAAWPPYRLESLLLFIFSLSIVEASLGLDFSFIS